MKHNSVFLATLAILGFGVVLDGCEVNPFFPPDTIKSTTSSSGTGGSGQSSGNSSSSGGCTCSDDSNACTDDAVGACPNGDPAACHTPKAIGASCPTGVCDDKGACVDCLNCTDAACSDRCNGLDCTAGTDCKSGFCSQTKCCNEDCQGPCRACDGPVAGTCTRKPVGLQLSGCDAGKVCDNMGACVAQTKAALGALCTTNADCQSGLCRRQYCQSKIDEPCSDHLECETSLCDATTKTCKSCTGAGAGMCPMGSTCDAATGYCQVFLGQPADTNAECASGTVIQFLCSLPTGAACTAHHDCVGRNCDNGKCSVQCTTAADCADGGPCSANGVCGMVAGNYCVINEHCKSGMCGGFPRKCL